MTEPRAQGSRGLPRLPPPPRWAEKLFTVGVTGTNGKTTTTALIAAALRSAGAPVPRVTTVGSFIDEQPLEVTRDLHGFLATMRAGLERGARFAAIELTSEALALGFAKAWPCRIGVFTNLTHDHLDSHRSAEHYLASKAQLFLHLPAGGTAVINGMDPASALLAEIVPEGVSVLRYGVPSRQVAMPVGEPGTAGALGSDAIEMTAPDAATAQEGQLDLWAQAVELSWEGTRAEIGARGALGKALEQAGVRSVAVQSIGQVYVENALAALAAAVAAGASPASAARALAAAPRPPGRFEPLAERPRVVLDYAHSPDALWRTLLAAKSLCRGRLWVVFGAGGNRDRAKRLPMGQAAREADHVVLTSDNPRDEDPAVIAAAIREGLGPASEVEVEVDRRAAITRAVLQACDEDVVVVAGKGHETHQEVRGELRPLSDRDAVREALTKRNAAAEQPP